MTSSLVEFSPKQLEFVRNANSRWNGKIGATRCGKTFVDVAYTIPSRLRERKGKKGLNVILGVSKSTIERNLLEPMRNFHGEHFVSIINSENIATIFGEKVYCLGAEKISQVSKIRGAEFKYCYVDELVDCNREVFELLKTRLSLPYSICDFTGNPSDPDHWLKEFIDTQAKNKGDCYIQNWTIYDNPFLPASFVTALEQEFRGTVYYKRYILGEWARAEGVIYKPFAEDNDKYLVDEVSPDELWFINVGIDFGNNASSHTFVATGFTYNYKRIIVLRNKRITETLTPTQLDNEFYTFCQGLYDEYHKPFTCRCDSAETTLINGFKAAIFKFDMQHYCTVQNALKKAINNRIVLTIRLMAENRLFVKRDCLPMIHAFNNAVWDTKKPDDRLDVTGPTNPVDMLDAFEYSIEEFGNDLIRTSLI